MGQLVLWGGWLIVSIFVFGLSAATITHPYYLYQLAAPCAAVMAIGLAVGWRRFRHRAWLCWALPTLIAITAGYQLYLLRAMVPGWVQALVILVVVAAVGVLVVALAMKVTETPLARMAAIVGCLALLVVPGNMSVDRAGIVMGGQRSPPPGTGYGAPTQLDPSQRTKSIANFIAERRDAGSVFAIGALSASDVAPFIVDGIPAVAIGGFAGRDAIFTVESFEKMASEGELRYFLLPGHRRMGIGSIGVAGPQGDIVSAIQSEWWDVSAVAGLPLGMLYRYGTGRASVQFNSYSLPTEWSGGHKYYRWRLSVDELPEVLDGIETVEYVLGPNFPEPVQVRHEPEDGFALEISGRTEFNIVIRVTFKDGRVEDLVYRLDY